MRAYFLLLALALMGRGLAQQAGELDLSFDSDGKLILPGFGPARSVFSLPNGAIRVVASRVQSQNTVPCVIGLLNDGAIDSTYASNGIYTITSPPPSDYSILYANDSLYFAHSSNDSLLLISQFDRYGSIVQEYGVLGVATIQPGSSYSLTQSIVRSDGSIYFCGDRIRQGFFPPVQDGFVARVNGSGVLDETFAGMGLVTFDGNFDFGSSRSVAGMAFLPGESIAVLVQHVLQTFPGSYATAGILSQSGSISGSIAVPSAIGEGSAVLIEANWLGSTLSVVEGCFGFNCQSEQHRAGVRSVNNEGASTYVRWSDFQEEGHEAGFISTSTCDAQGDFIIAGGFFDGQQSGSWFLAKLAQTATGFMMDFGTDGFSSVAGVTGLRTSTSQPDGKVILGGGTSYVGDPRCILVRFHNIPDPRSTLSLRMFLGGAYDSTAFLMRDDLRQQGLIPTLQPYAAPFFSAANGVGTWATPQHVLQTEGDSAVVDWVWLELISATDSATVVATRVGLVHRDGWVTSADGHSPIDFSAGTGSYFVRARHRDHLGVTASQAITLGPSVTTLDLTDPATPTFGTNAQMEANGVRMLWPGDANSDGVVKYVGSYNDRDRILLTVGGGTPTATFSGYRSEDLNLDGVVKYVGTANDRDIILQVIDGVPTAVRVQQVP